VLNYYQKEKENRMPDLRDNPMFCKVAKEEQFYKYLRLLFEDVEHLKFQVNELQKDLQAKCSRINKLEDENNELKKR
jgi:FtsZ-binding cell division protein ZapB